MFILGCTVNALELFFVTDESGSIGSDNYQRMKEFIYGIIDAFEIGPNDVRVGLMSFSNSHLFQFHLNTYSTKAPVLSAVQALPYAGGPNTNTAGALEAIRSEAFTQAHGARPVGEGVPRVVIVITDGTSDDSVQTEAAATELHDDGYVVLAVGIQGANIDELNSIASDPAYVSFIDSFDQDQLNALQWSISKKACGGKHMHSGSFDFLLCTCSISFIHYE